MVKNNINQVRAGAIISYILIFFNILLSAKYCTRYIASTGIGAFDCARADGGNSVYGIAYESRAVESIVSSPVWLQRRVYLCRRHSNVQSKWVAHRSRGLLSAYRRRPCIGQFGVYGIYPRRILTQ